MMPHALVWPVSWQLMRPSRIYIWYKISALDLKYLYKVCISRSLFHVLYCGSIMSTNLAFPSVIKRAIIYWWKFASKRTVCGCSRREKGHILYFPCWNATGSQWPWYLFLFECILLLVWYIHLLTACAHAALVSHRLLGSSTPLASWGGWWSPDKASTGRVWGLQIN